MHKAGYTYNDLKPENLLMNNTTKGELKITLIDFGFAQKFEDLDRTT